MTESLRLDRQSRHGLAYGILVAAWGETQANHVWDGWTPSERDEAATAADQFRPALERAAEQIRNWLEGVSGV